jgi:hypothetical protein
MKPQGTGNVNSMQKSLSVLLHARFLLGLSCDPEDGGDVAFCYVKRQLATAMFSFASTELWLHVNDVRNASSREI